MPPLRSGGQPTGGLMGGTTTAGVAYGSMGNTFSTTGGTAHSTLVTGLVNGNSYNYYVRCQDAAGNTNPDDFVISFSVSVPGS